MRSGTRLALATAGGLVVSALLGTTPASAATYYWSGNGTDPGGPGTWNTVDARWGADPTGPFTTIWDNGGVHSAVFGNTPTAGTVNLGGPITVNLITTERGGYSIGNGNGVITAANRLVFSGADAGIHTAHTTGTTTLTAFLDGQTLIKTGPGRLEINNSGNLGNNKFVLKGGALTAPAPSRFGAPAALVQDFFTFDGGGFGSNTTTPFDFGANRGFTINAGGAFFSSTSAANIITVGAPIVGVGGITVGGGSPQFTGSAHAAGVILLLNNPANSYAGGTTVTQGTLRLGANDVVPNTGTVTLNGGTMDLNGFSDTIGTLIVNSSASTIIPTSGTPTLTAAAYDLRASGTISAVLAGGGVVATKTTAGVVSLTAANTFDGGFNINEGTVRVNNNASLGAAGSPVSIGNNTTLSTTSTTGRTLNYAYTVDGNFTLGQATGGTAAVTMAGTMNLNGGTRTVTLANAADTISAVISNGGLVIEAGTGILSLTGNNTYSGSTTINSGTVTINATNPDGLGDGTGALNLAGGNFNTSANRSVTTAPVKNPLNMTADASITTTGTAATTNLNFNSNSIAGSAGTLTFRNDSATVDSLFDPRFSGSGFDFTRPIVVANGVNGNTRLSFFNETGVQTFSGDISGNGNIRRSASNAGQGATTILSGNNTYTGTTAINDGTLLVNGTHTGAGNYTVLSNGTLGGNGDITFASGAGLTVNGTLAPGNSIGTLNVLAGDVTLAGVADFEIDLTSSTFDKLNVGDLLTYGGTLNIIFTGAAPLGGSYDLFDFDSQTGAFTLFTDNGGLDPAQAWSFDHATGVVTVTAVPEPAALALLGIGGLGLLARRRRIG